MGNDKIDLIRKELIKICQLYHGGENPYENYDSDIDCLKYNLWEKEDALIKRTDIWLQRVMTFQKLSEGAPRDMALAVYNCVIKQQLKRMGVRYRKLYDDNFRAI